MKRIQVLRSLYMTIGLFVAVIVSGFSFQMVKAVEGESLTLSPASKQLQLKAGGVFKDKLTVINDGTVAYTLKLYATPYSVENNSYSPDFDSTVSNADVYQWVQFEKNEYTLNPGEKTEIPYSISVPADAAPGGHYGVLFAETQSDQNSGQISRNKRVGTIVYATVEGEFITAGRQISAQIDKLQLGGPITASLTIENTGNSDFVMKDYIRVNNVLGAKVYEKSNERVMLPKTTRDIQMNWTDGPIMGLYKVTTESVVLDKSTTQSSWVLLMPAWVLVVLILAIVGIIYYAFFRHRR